MAFGFTPANWQELKNALLDHPRNNPYVSTTTTPYGEKYEVQCSLLTPDTQNPCVRSFWIVLAANPSPQFITGYAAPLQGECQQRHSSYCSTEVARSIRPRA